MTSSLNGSNKANLQRNFFRSFHRSLKKFIVPWPSIPPKELFLFFKKQFLLSFLKPLLIIFSNLLLPFLKPPLMTIVFRIAFFLNLFLKKWNEEWTNSVRLLRSSKVSILHNLVDWDLLPWEWSLHTSSNRWASIILVCCSILKRLFFLEYGRTRAKWYSSTNEILFKVKLFN